MSEQNPKLVGSGIVDCIPQTGECPMGCPECFYTGGRFYRTLDEPLWPTAEEANGKVLRVNSGHDSNLDGPNISRAELIKRVAGDYENFFFNTSIPNFDFPGPVVFTCNGRESLSLECSENVMFVRVRVNTWDLVIQDRLVEHYLKEGVPVVLTFMRYYEVDSVPKDHQPLYAWKRHVLNEYWCPTPRAVIQVMGRYAGKGVRMCGTPASSFCVDCRNCELLYWDWKRSKRPWRASKRETREGSGAWRSPR